MKNHEVAKILLEIGEYLDMQSIAFKPRAYEKVAGVIDGLEEDVEQIYERGGLKALEEIPGVGVSIAEKIEEYLKTGRIKYYEELKKKTPVDLSTLTQVEGLGPKKIKKLYEKLGIKDLDDLEKAAKVHKIGSLEGFGLKSEENILQGIEFLRKSGGRFILGFAMPAVKEIEERLRRLKEVKKVVVAGSIRRKKETIGDVDILIVSMKPKPVMDYFTSMPEVINVYAKGDTKSAIKIKNGLDVDLRVVPEESFGAALNYFTGSKDHNVSLRRKAMEKGYKLNEYGLYKIKNAKIKNQNDKSKIKKLEIQIAGKTEEDLYKALGLDYIEPELREMTGEIEAAYKHKLPKLIGYDDLKGDLQTQSNWTDGANSIEELAQAALKAGLEYIAITDHTKRLAMTHGLDEKKLRRQMAKIDKINSKFKIQNSKFKILKGTECDILKDGSLDIDDKVLSQLDVVGASVHSYFNLPKEEQTERLVRAVKNPHVDILFHPTGRIINKRQAYEVDMDEIINVAALTGTILEIDALPDRLDLKDEHVRKCVAKGVKLAIDSDAHSATHFAYLEYGIAQARRGWATREDIINTRPLEKMKSFLKNSER
ncbi:MAG: DNA polymerase III [Parcubacteria group bacterium CG1_02_42_13]|uniref:DNA polymerase beta n=1 Tax=Candidatus Colwellbacteria bacterium CG23_combo_of_CG06-09_8_20_14_all_42_19 TaxID=1974541 RepID=A0A2H0ALM8_9BACT|nr:MAG: DNA polymerase III [Parcubacteria group bacterium CG1_02_42_13]PIP46283.1 MAG: DNA polymerase III [Candidatus Colwellbacteria bacterium CG23_combo_of_CG06-09_8_20_14_all_42_19]